MRSSIFLVLLCLISGNSFIHAQDNLEKHTLTGSVVIENGDVLEPLVGAHILAYGTDTTVVIGRTTSDLTGHYKLSLSSAPFEVRISYVGYQTLILKDISRENNTIHLGQSNLLSQNILDETVITGASVQRTINAEEYLITDEMRAKATNTLELLDQVHGLRYDKISNSIRVGNETNVLILVNNMEQSKEYALNLNPNRIAKVSVTRNPKGRYQTEGYEAIVNISLKTQYVGYDATLQNFAITNLSGNNGNDWLMSAQPAMNLVYTNRKINVYANYTFMTADWNMPIVRDVRYEGIREMYSDKVTKKHPNDIYDYRANVITGGLNYKLNDKHNLSYQGTYLYENTSSKTDFNYNVVDLSNGNSSSYSTSVGNDTREKNYKGTLYYSGKIRDKLSIYSDFTYNYYINNVGNLLNENNSAVFDNQYKDRRDFIQFNADFKYMLNDRFALNFGYATNYRKYDSETLSKTPILNYKELRHKGFAYLEYNASDKLGIELGSAVEYINMGKKSNTKTYWKLLPTVEINYTPTDYLNVKTSYITRLYSPSLAQLSPVTTAIDPLLSQKGNPDLSASLRHTLSMDINLWDKLTITPRLRYTPQMTNEYYYKENGAFYLTYQNMNLKEYSLQVIYDQPIGKYFGLNAGVTYYHNKIKYGGLSNSTNGCQIDAEVNYFNPKHSLMLQFGYYRSMDKSVQLQGFQMLNFDSWMLSANKSFFKDRMSVMFAYFLPLKWGVRDTQRRQIATSFYSENYNIGVLPYRNLLMMRISFRLSKGKSSYSRNRATIDREQRINHTFDF